MGIMENKTMVVTGVLRPNSIAFHVARIAQSEGARVILTSFGRAARLTELAAGKLSQPVPIIPLDVTNEEELAAFADRLREHTDQVDALIHSIGFAKQSTMGGDFLAPTWDEVSVGIETSAFSLKSLAQATLPLLNPGAGIVGLTFDASKAWPVYDWMGVAKAAFESTARYLARDLGGRGVRVNLVSAGPIRTTAATSIPGFEQLESSWDSRAPLGWAVDDPEPTARAVVALASPWFGATTGEIVHVDGGVHAMGV